MESLLSLSFDNISSRNINKIRKGIRQIEGLLAQICLSSSAILSPQKRVSSVIQNNSVDIQLAAKSLRGLTEDPAFQEFFRLQDNFEWNVATRLIETLERLLGMPSDDPSTNSSIHSTLIALEGVLLLHPRSQALFCREVHLTLLLDLLDLRRNSPEVVLTALEILMVVLNDNPRNLRMFEEADGIESVRVLIEMRNTAEHSSINRRVREFLAVYLLPEEPQPSQNPFTLSASNAIWSSPISNKHADVFVSFGNAQRQNSTSKCSETRKGSGSTGGQTQQTKSVEDKQLLLSRHLQTSFNLTNPTSATIF